MFSPTHDSPKKNYLFALTILVRGGGWEDRWSSVKLHLPLELVCSRLDRHPRAVESKRKEAFLSAKSLVARSKFALW